MTATYSNVVIPSWPGAKAMSSSHTLFLPAALGLKPGDFITVQAPLTDGEYPLFRVLSVTQLPHVTGKEQASVKVTQYVGYPKSQTALSIPWATVKGIKFKACLASAAGDPSAITKAMAVIESTKNGTAKTKGPVGYHSTPFKIIDKTPTMAELKKTWLASKMVEGELVPGGTAVGGMASSAKTLSIKKPKVEPPIDPADPYARFV